MFVFGSNFFRQCKRTNLSAKKKLNKLPIIFISRNQYQKIQFKNQHS